jgi:curved DNA-binding protein CbpA
MNARAAQRILGVPPGAGADVVRRAWRDLAQVWHPDRFGHDARLREKAERNLQRINAAYAILKDGVPAQRPGVAARLSDSFGAILGLGDLGEPPVPAGPGAPPTAGPTGSPLRAGLRRSLRVLGLDTPPTRRRRSGARRLVLLLVALAGALAALLLARP